MTTLIIEFRAFLGGFMIVTRKGSASGASCDRPYAAPPMPHHHRLFSCRECLRSYRVTAGARVNVDLVGAFDSEN